MRVICIDDVLRLFTEHERHLKRLNDQKFKPYIVEYNLKEDWNVGYAVRCMGLGL